MKSKSLGNLIILFGIFLILCSAVLIGYNLWDAARADQSAQTVLHDLAPVIPQKADLPAVSVCEPTLPATEASIPSETEYIPPYILNPDLEMPETVVNGISYIGILEIPDLQLELPIASQWNAATARTAPCRYSGSVYSGDMVVAGHNYQKHFGRLPSLPISSTLKFTDTDGNVFHYEIMECETVQATDLEGMCTGNWDLTLFTCTIGGRARFAIRCSLLENT